MQKIEVEYLEYMWPMRHFLITCGTMQGEKNIITVSFCMPVSKTPPMLVCAIGQEMYSNTLIEQTKEFVVNDPYNKSIPIVIVDHYILGIVNGGDSSMVKTKLDELSSNLEKLLN